MKVAPVTELEISNQHIILSVDWCTDHNTSQICVSDSAGNVSIVWLDENLQLKLVHTFEAHKNEAWAATYGFIDEGKIYSGTFQNITTKNASTRKSLMLFFNNSLGADDTLLKITDIRSGKQISELREHTGGVTSIRFNHLKRHIFASGR